MALMIHTLLYACMQLWDTSSMCLLIIYQFPWSRKQWRDGLTLVTNLTERPSLSPSSLSHSSCRERRWLPYYYTKAVWREPCGERTRHSAAALLPARGRQRRTSLWVWGQPALPRISGWQGLHRDTLSQNTKQNKTSMQQLTCQCTWANLAFK